jgi:hypothetical protein|tara:strand:+ start:439 stop:573 length:135 start_codon:yes stop_codon:yes gene_type:complete
MKRLTQFFAVVIAVVSIAIGCATNDASAPPAGAELIHLKVDGMI